MLDEITTLQFHGKLDVQIMTRDQCNTLIASFQKKRGAEFMPENMHNALQWGPGDPYLEWPHSNLDWQLIKLSAHDKRNTKATETKSETTTAGIFNSGKHKDVPEARLEMPLKKLNKERIEDNKVGDYLISLL